MSVETGELPLVRLARLDVHCTFTQPAAKTRSRCTDGHLSTDGYRQKAELRLQHGNTFKLVKIKVINFQLAIDVGYGPFQRAHTMIYCPKSTVLDIA